MAKWQWCLVNNNDVLLTGWQKIGDYWYYLKPNGVMATGWIQDTSNTKWYFLDTNGQMKTGWIQDNSLWYYLDGSGAMYSNGTYNIDGKDYTFNEKGVWQDGSSYISDDCVNFVKVYEAFYPNKYYDCVGVLTQGYGMTGSEISDLPDEISEETASNLLKSLINEKYAKVIKDDLDSKGVTLSQNQFDALVSMAYNIGTGALLRSTLYRNVCNGVRNESTILSNFQAWSKAGGKTLQGLFKRRTAEANIFLYGVYDASH